MKSRARLLLASCLVLGAAAPASRAAMAAGGDELERERTAAYSEGVALANAGRWEEAEKRFLRVVAIRSAPPALFTLGQAQEHTGQLATAERTYDAAYTAARAAGNTHVAEACRRALGSIDPRVPRLVVRLAGPARGATVTIDGASAAFDQPVKVDPGAHVVAARAEDRKPFETRARLGPGQNVEVTVELEPLATPPAPPAPPTQPAAPAAATASEPTPAEPAPPAEAEPHAGLPLGPLFLGGAGVATALAGIVVRFAAQSSYDSANGQCGPAGCPSQSVVDEGNGARAQMIVGTILAGVGIAAVAGAGVWWLTVGTSHGGAGATVTARF
jgi:hypothetical protein